MKEKEPPLTWEVTTDEEAQIIEALEAAYQVYDQLKEQLASLGGVGVEDYKAKVKASGLTEKLLAARKRIKEAEAACDAFRKRVPRSSG